MRLAEEQRELRGIVRMHGLDSSIQRDAGIAAAPAIGSGRDTTDAADVHLLAVPTHRSKVNADVTGQATLVSIDQYTQLRVGPFDMAPGEIFHLGPRPYSLEQLLGPGPGLIAVHNVDLDAQSVSLAFNGHPFLRAARAPSYRSARNREEIAPEESCL